MQRVAITLILGSPDSVIPQVTWGLFVLSFDLILSETEVWTGFVIEILTLSNVSQQGPYLKMVHGWISPSMQPFPCSLFLNAVLWHSVEGQISVIRPCFFSLSLSFLSFLSLCVFGLSLSIWFCLSRLFSLLPSHISTFDFLWLGSFVSLYVKTLSLLKGRVGYFIVSFTTEDRKAISHMCTWYINSRCACTHYADMHKFAQCRTRKKITSRCVLRYKTYCAWNDNMCLLWFFHKKVWIKVLKITSAPSPSESMDIC